MITPTGRVTGMVERDAVSGDDQRTVLKIPSDASIGVKSRIPSGCPWSPDYDHLLCRSRVVLGTGVEPIMYRSQLPGRFCKAHL